MVKYVLRRLVVWEREGGGQQFEHFVVEDVVERIFLDKADQGGKQLFVSAEEGAVSFNLETNVEGFKELEANHAQSWPIFLQVLLQLDNSPVHVTLEPFLQLSGLLVQVAVGQELTND